MTPGMKSSEFLLAVLVAGAALLLALAGRIDGEAALTAITGVSAAYGLSRGIAKHG